MKHDTRAAAADLIAHGWAPVPIPSGEKGPRAPGWKDTVFAPADFAPGGNLGVKNGEPSGGMADVDLDAPEAVAVAPGLLLATGLIHGRPSKPASHWWYRCPGAPGLTRKAPDGAMLVELRTTGGQTVVPPSVHPSGERLAWDRDGAPAAPDPDALVRAVNLVATAALLARHWPAGSRHDAAGAMAGTLARLGLSPAETERVIWEAAKAAGDEEADDRRRFARETAAKADRDGGAPATTGGPSLARALGADGPKIVARLMAFWGKEDEDRIDRLNDRHFFTRLGKDPVVATLEADGELVFQTTEAFAKMLMHVRVPRGKAGDQGLGDAWLRSPRRRGYRRVVFAPPPAPCAPEDFNLWRGFATDPAPDASGAGCRRYLDHLEGVICGGDAAVARYLLDYMAAAVQRPGDPGEAAVVLRGPMGAGKGMLIREFGALFGRHYIQVDKGKHVTGAFNQHLSGKVVVFADEAVWAGDKGAIGALKRLITEPTLTIERKGFDAVEERNVIHLFMATNEAWAVPAGLKERRFLFLDVGEGRAQDHRYFAALLDDMRDGGRAALLAFLAARDLTGVDLRAVPRTAGLRDQVERSVDPELRWWREVLERGIVGPGDGWPDWLATEQAHADFVDWAATLGVQRRPAAGELVKALRPLWGSPSATQRRVAVDAPRATFSGRQTSGKVPRWGHALPPLAEARALFDRAVGIPSEWPEPTAFGADDQKPMPF